MPPSAAQQLVNIIAQAVKDIEDDTAAKLPGAVTTDLNSPVVAPEDALHIDSERRAAWRSLKAATHQLLATLSPAGYHVLELQHSYQQTSALNTVLQARIADLIHSSTSESNEEGVHVEVIAERAGMDARKLSHILRFLALRNVFCELRPNYWANNRLSFPLRTDSPNSLHNYLLHIGEEVALPGLVELPRILLDKQPDGAFSWDHKHSAFQKYFKPGCDFFEFIAKSQDGYRVQRFGQGMLEATRSMGMDVAHKAFDWSKLGPDGTLIDVGGGIGAAAYPISTYLPDWKLVVQDRGEVIKHGIENYNKSGSGAKIEFEEADFLKEQPAHRVQQVDVYFLRHILHDWPAKSCVQILSHLRNAAKPNTRLLVWDIDLKPPIVQRDSPLLSNGGMAASASHHINMTMLALFNAEERTEQDFEVIFDKSGWKLASITPLPLATDASIFEATPNPEWRGSK